MQRDTNLNLMGMDRGIHQNANRQSNRIQHKGLHRRMSVDLGP